MNNFKENIKNTGGTSGLDATTIHNVEQLILISNALNNTADKLTQELGEMKEEDQELMSYFMKVMLAVNFINKKLEEGVQIVDSLSSWKEAVGNAAHTVYLSPEKTQEIMDLLVNVPQATIQLTGLNNQDQRLLNFQKNVKDKVRNDKTAETVFGLSNLKS